MLRSLINSCLKVGGSTFGFQCNSIGLMYNFRSNQPQLTRCFSAIVSQNSSLNFNDSSISNSLGSWRTPSSFPRLQLTAPLLLQQQSRTVVKFGFGKGKRQTVKSVPARFRRLDWGIWIRRIAGAHKKLWKKNNKRRMRMERHVFVNATRSRMLDKMVSKYWRTPKYWVDDPYAPYQKREEFPLTRLKPRSLPAGVSFPLDR